MSMVMTLPTVLHPADRSDMIEKIFERVEAESARRAEEEASLVARIKTTAELEAEADVAAADELEKADAEASQLEADDSMPSPVSPSPLATAAAAAAGSRGRRRGSVSVSRFGMPTESCPEPVSIGTPLSPSTRPSRSSSLVIHPPQMYNVQTTNHGSEDSLASAHEDPVLQFEEQGHSTTMATITGKQSISKAISQRLSRARTRSRDVLTTSNTSGNFIIGVAVQEATVEHHEEPGTGEETPQATVVKSTVQAPQGVKRQRSAPKLDAGHSSWMARAKELTSRFKRKSMAALSQVS